MHNAYPLAVFSDQSNGEASASNADKNETQDFYLPGTAPSHVNFSDGISCKMWPEQPTMIIVAVALEHGLTSEERTNADLEIIMADSQTSAIIYRTIDPGILTSDAVSATLKGIDTGRYLLSVGTTAFGVRVTHIAQATGVALEFESLRLYRIEGGRILPTLGDLTMTSQWEESEYMDKSKCGSRRSIRRTLDMLHEKHNGFFDMAVHEIKISGECLVSKGTGIEHWANVQRSNVYHLTYNGTRYVIPSTINDD